MVPPGEVHMPVCMCVYVYMYVFVHVSNARMCLGGCLMRWFYFGGEGEGTFAPPWKSVPSLHTNIHVHVHVHAYNIHVGRV